MILLCDPKISVLVILYSFIIRFTIYSGYVMITMQGKSDVRATEIDLDCEVFYYEYWILHQK